MGSGWWERWSICFSLIALSFGIIVIKFNIIPVNHRLIVIEGNSITSETLQQFCNDKLTRLCDDTYDEYNNPAIMNTSKFVDIGYGLKRESTLHELYKDIESKHGQELSLHVYYKSDIYRAPLEKYLTYNQVYASKGTNIILNSEYYVYNNILVNQSDIMEVINITHHSRLPILIGQTGVIAKRFIPKGTILGQYMGNEYFSYTHDNYFDKCEMWYRKKYRFFVQVFNTFKDKNEKLAIDPFPQYSNPLIHLNDVRYDITKVGRSSKESELENIVFLEVLINNWPHIVWTHIYIHCLYIYILWFVSKIKKKFVGASKDIHKGSEILSYYGDDY